MRLLKTMSIAALVGLAVVPAASAYEIDPVTRMPLVMADDGRVRAAAREL